MWTDNARWTQDRLTFKRNLMQSIRNLLDSYNVEVAALKDGLEKAFDGADRDFDNMRAQMLGLTLWHVFEGGGLWIGSRTSAGNVIPDDVLVTAYAMWRNARNFASRHGADTLMACSAMELAAHITTDNLAKGDFPGSVRKYMFGVYRKRLATIVGRSGYEFEKVDVLDRRLSDSGASSAGMENRVFARELLRFMPPKPREIAHLRHYWGYDWQEVAEVTGMSVSAVRKALCVGLRKAYERHMENVSKSGKPKKKRKTAGKGDGINGWENT